MSAIATVSDHNLEERIYRLQKPGLDAGVRSVVDEAAKLCSDGRHIEAAALVEKAEAMKAIAAGPESGTAPAKGQDMAARLVTDVANGLAKVLVGALQEVEQHLTGESRRSTVSLTDRLDKLQNVVEGLLPLNGRIDQLVQAGLAVQENYQQLAATAESLKQTDARHDAELDALRGEMREFASSTFVRVDELCSRIEGQERELSTVNSSLSSLAGRVAAASERLERHAEAIRSVHQVHHDLGDVLGRLSGFAPQSAHL